jgi:hypothetical protein
MADETDDSVTSISAKKMRLISRLAFTDDANEAVAIGADLTPRSLAEIVGEPAARAALERDLAGRALLERRQTLVKATAIRDSGESTPDQVLAAARVIADLIGGMAPPSPEAPAWHNPAGKANAFPTNRPAPPPAPEEAVGDVKWAFDAPLMVGESFGAVIDLRRRREERQARGRNDLLALRVELDHPATVDLAIYVVVLDTSGATGGQSILARMYGPSVIASRWRDLAGGETAAVPSELADGLLRVHVRCQGSPGRTRLRIAV